MINPINLLLYMVIPKKLGIAFGTAFAVGSFLFSAVEGERRTGKMERAQKLQSRVERGIQNEQAGRERRSQIRQASVATAQAESIQLAQGGQAAGGGSGGVSSAVSTNLSRNIGAVNFAQDTSNLISSARTNVANASRPSALGLVNTQLQPLLFSNVDALNTFFEDTFSSNTGTP